MLTSPERYALIDIYATYHGIATLIETGTLTGDCAWTLKDAFTEIYTIELSESFYEQATHRFAGTNVHCIHGDSGEVLPGLLAELDRPVVAWLDGHFCGGETAKASYGNTPVVKELDALFQDPHWHVILVDDARIFGGGPEFGIEYPDYPDISWIMEQASMFGYTFTLVDDVMRLTHG